MANYLITGYWGSPHVTAENDRGIHAGILGAGRFVLPVGNEFNAEYIGNNTIRLYDGKLMDNGAAAGIPAGEYVDLLIANASQGMKRNDLIVFQYSQDSSTAVETGSFVVIQGTETSGTASDPALTQADLLTGKATLDQMALWRVAVSGTAISAPVKMFTVSKTIPEKANSSHSHSLSGSAMTGTLPVSKGGTGATSASAARTALGVTPANIGALPTSGGTLTGSLNIGNKNAATANWKGVGACRLSSDGKTYYAEFGVDISGSAVIYLYDAADMDTVINMLKLGTAETLLGKPLSIGSGGTGAKTAGAARAALGITPANIGALPTSGGVLTSHLNIRPQDTAATDWTYIGVNRKHEDVVRSVRMGIGGSGDAAVYLYDANDSTSSLNSLRLYDDRTTLGKPLALASGGTGATTAAAARTNLGITAANLGITHGTTAATTVEADSKVDIDVSFGKTYTSPPTVVASLVSASEAAGIGNVSVAVIDGSITTTGCKVRLFNADSSRRQPSVSWIAVGV